MVKFLHTGDWQLGQTLKLVGPDRAEELRKSRLEAIENLLALARAEDVDFILSAGDNFESNQVSDGLIRKTITTLNDCSTVPIYIIPGNHDPLMEDYPFTRGVLGQLDDHIHILTEEEPVDVPQVNASIYPGICRHKKDSHSPIDWVPGRKPEDGVRVGLAHGSWQVLPELPDDDYPIAEDAATEKDLDYLALGHWHSTFSSPAESPQRTYYSGTPEPTSFNEGDSGNVLIVEIHEPKDKPQIVKQSVAKYSWAERDVGVSDEVSLEYIRDELLSLDVTPKKTLLNLDVSGTTSLEVVRLYDDLLDDLEDRFYFVRDDRTDLSLIPTDEEIQSISTGKGWLKGAVENLETLVADNCEYVPDGWPFDDPPKKEEAERALALIYTKVDEEGG